jgi:hypothetical protein
LEIGLTYCGDPDAFYAWPVETQERVLGWWRTKHAPPSKPKRATPKARAQDTVDPAAKAFWGI